MNMYDAMVGNIADQVQKLREEMGVTSRLEWEGLKEIVGKKAHDQIVGNLPRTEEDTLSSDRWA